MPQLCIIVVVVVELLVLVLMISSCGSYLFMAYTYCQIISPSFLLLTKVDTFRTCMLRKLYKSTNRRENHILEAVFRSSQHNCKSIMYYTWCAYVTPKMPTERATAVACRIFISRSKNSGTSGSSGTLISGHFNVAVVHMHSIRTKGVLMTLKYSRFL